MSRLLFAAARGARVEQRLHYNKWTPGVDLGLLRWHPELCRVHPDDEHLQYGPISTALRELELWELMSSQFPAVAVHAALACGLDSEWVVTWRTQGVGDRATALLVLAEALADEGV